MSDLQALFFSKPHPLPPQIPPQDDVGNFGKRSKNYGKTKGVVLEEARKRDKFSAADLALASGISRATVNRALLRLAKSGKVEKVENQTAGSSRTAAIWRLVTSRP